MSAKIHLYTIVFLLLTACGAPAVPSTPTISHTLGVQEPTLTPTPPPPTATEMLTPTPDPTATPQLETVTFMMSGIVETTMLKKDTKTFNLRNGQQITMPKIQMAGVEPGHNVNRLLEKALAFHAENFGFAWGVFLSGDIHLKPNDPNDPHTNFIKNLWIIPGFIRTVNTPIAIPYGNSIPAIDRFEITFNGLEYPNKGVILGIKNPEQYHMFMFLPDMDANEIKTLLKSNTIKIPSRTE